MGFFDSLKKIFDTVGSTESRTVEKAPSTPMRPQNKTPDDIIKSASIPAKPSIRRETTFFGGAEGNDEFAVTFMLSGDFVEFNSHCEIDPSFQYEPFSTDDFTGYNDDLASIGFGPYDPVYCAVEKYVKDGTASGREFMKSESRYFLFRAKFDYGNRILCAYAFAPGTSMEYQMLGLNYNPDVEGTPLEKKLIAALDEAAMTYTETKTNK
ncbi:MAG: hypothetical protein IJ496_09050 [Ruminococcus sp.]|nr:hypothetical protein [Ruminococcus sp.]